MLAKDILVFNTANTTESDNVGAYVRDSAGNLIDGQTIATKRWLDVAAAVFDGSGNAINSTSNALNTYITGGSITVTQTDNGLADKTTFTYGTTFEQPVGGAYQDTSPSLTAGQSGVVRLTANRAFHVNLRDASGNALLGSAVSAASIPVVIASDQGAVATTTTSDPAIANTSIKASAVSVTTTAAALIASALTGRKYFSVQNNGAVSIFVGDSAVTSSTGTRVPPGAAYEQRIGAANSLYAVAATGTVACAVLELS